MRTTKNSGFEWIGEIPTSWELYKGKYMFTQRNLRGNTIELQLLSPTQKYGVVPQSVYEDRSGMNAVKLNKNANLSALKTIHKGDFCISLRSFQGGFEYSEYEGVVSPAYQVFYPVVKVARGYYKYLFKDSGFIEKMNSYTMTLRDGKNIAFADFGNTYIPCPPVDEQQRIADFLDTKCAEIDALTADIQTQIDTLEQYKRSVITETVTKGLNPDAEMKDSGIQWIGNMPAHWDVIRGKYILRYMQKPVREDDGVITCFRDGEVTLRSNRREDGFTMSDKEIGYQGIDVGDLVVHGMDGFAGSIGISDSRGKASPVLNVLNADAVIADKKAQLATLDEYKKSLIFEYVTGKKEVPVS